MDAGSWSTPSYGPIQQAINKFSFVVFIGGRASRITILYSFAASFLSTKRITDLPFYFILFFRYLNLLGA